MFFSPVLPSLLLDNMQNHSSAMTGLALHDGPSVLGTVQSQVGESQCANHGKM